MCLWQRVGRLGVPGAGEPDNYRECVPEPINDRESAWPSFFQPADAGKGSCIGVRKLPSALVFVLIALFLILSSWPAGAAWEGVHRFSLAVQGSVNSMDQLSSTSFSVPVEFRATISVTVDRAGAAGEHTGRLRITDAYVREEGELLPLSVPSLGYRIILRPNGSHEVLDDVSSMSAYGIDLNEILHILFPAPQSQPLVGGSSWSADYTQTLVVDDRTLTLPVKHTFTVNEVRNTLAVVQSSLRGTASIALSPGHLSGTQLGAGSLHLDAETGLLIRSAVTVRSTIERTVPFGALIPQEHSVLSALVTTSVERLEAPPVPVASLGAAYHDPAGRFSLRLPEGWEAQPVHMDHSLTLFSSEDQTQLLFVEVQEASTTQSALELAERTLSRYAQGLVDFAILTGPTEHIWHGHPAAFAEYQYFATMLVQEGALYAQVDGYNVSLQYAVYEDSEAKGGIHLLELLANHFELGPTPSGQVSTEQLILAPTILYESEALALEIEMPMLWPPIEAADAAVAFGELGGAGQLTIHLESVASEESPVTLLTQWVNRLRADNPGVEVVSPAQQDALGPLSAASVVIDWTLGQRTVRQKVVAANLEGILYVVAVEYDKEGFEERAAAFERMLSSFRPRLDYIVAHMNTFRAYDPPPTPEGDEPFLLIGRILHEYTAQGSTTTVPAAEVRVDLSTDGLSYVAIADSEGFFYVANLPVEEGTVVTIDSVRGRLFNLPYDVHIPLGLSLTVQGQVGLVGEVVVVLNPDGETVSLQLETGFDEETATSRVHQAFLSRYPDSPWSELVRKDLAQRLAE